VGIGGNCTEEVIKSIKETNLNGLSAILSVSPYYNKPSQKGIEYHFTKIAENSPLPIIIYDVPSRTACEMSVNTILTLAEHENIIGIKEASANIFKAMDILRNRKNDFLFLSGDDVMTYPLMCLGANGVISVIANAMPENFSRMVNHCLNNRFNEALEIHNSLINIINLIFKEGSPTGVKALLNIMNIIPEEASALRLPLVEATENLKKEIKEEVNEKNFLC